MTLQCAVKDCENAAAVREIYLKPGGEGKFEDPVCSAHTGRNPRLQMIGKIPILGQLEYKLDAE